MNRLIGLMLPAAIVSIASPALAGPTVSVPEPASITMMAVGIAAVAWTKFRPRK